MSDIPMGRKCSKCKEWKLMDEFYEHATSRYGHEAQCKECRRAHQRQYHTTHPLSETQKKSSCIRARKWRKKHPDYGRQYRKENRDKINATVRRWRAKNPKKEKAAKRRYRAANQEKIKARRRKYAVENHEANLKKWRKYYWTHREKSITKNRKWFREHPDKKRIYKAKRRARKADAGGSFTAEEWRELCEKYDNHCLCCDEIKPLEPDHIVPISKGGHSNISNIQPLCKSCNASKGTKIIDYR